MSWLHPEECRKCTKCGHTWHAEKYGQLDRTQPMLGIGMTKRSQDLHRQTVHERREAKYNAYRFCPACGSKKIQTVRGASTPTSAAHPSTVTPAAAARVQAGWYADPLLANQLRYWDGTAWTNSISGQTAPPASQPLPPPPIPSPPHHP